MKKKQKYTIIFWIASILLTFAISYYQKLTGPTYPVNTKIEINGTEIKSILPRSHPGEGGEILKVYAPNKSIIAEMKFKRYKSYDDWTTVELTRTGDTLFAEIPHQPPAGKVEYIIYFTDENNLKIPFTENPLIIRFRGDVPAVWMISHIVFIFAAFMLSFRTGFEAFFLRDNTFKLTIYTVVFIILGGLIFGPIMQKYAFDAFWTGWPFGNDLTDNKTFVALIFWLIALWKLHKNRTNTKWVIIATIMMIIVFLIPHSIFGSEIDYIKMEQGK